jgi:glutamate synthase domain-containing protein 3
VTEPTEPTELELDASQLTCRELTERLNDLSGELLVRLSRSREMICQDGIAAGLNSGVTLTIDGSVGHFVYFLGQNGCVDVGGDAGACSGHSMISGRLVIRGRAGDAVGAYASGGLINVLGQAGNRCGQGLSGADIFIRSQVGDQAAYGMREGVLVLGNGAGEDVGQGMTGGTLFIRGEVKSMSDSVRPMRMKDADAMRLSLLLARCGVKGRGAEFRGFRPKMSLS